MMREKRCKRRCGWEDNSPLESQRRCNLKDVAISKTLCNIYQSILKISLKKTYIRGREVEERE